MATFIIGSLFGWVHKETKLRRFKEALIFMGRKMVNNHYFWGC
ncbi:putative phage terminase, large subunit-like protein [Staphylococcus aureus]|nr:putative phage terminase, large subunit-like protein [Staphylococcus aureus]